MSDETKLDWVQDIKNMMILFGQEVREKPSIPDEKTIKLRQSLIEEEFKELMGAMGFYNYVDYCGYSCWDRIITRSGPQKPDLVGIADGIGDLIVVLLGASHALGIDMNKVWQVIHESNMAKAIDGKIIYREDGKVLKPENWQKPDIKDCLKEQGME
jgi:predicted HAD superfamily Cof-like phosphohydrolase